jgi:tRNA(adenine34) deaminase
MFTEQDEHWMRSALELAKVAADVGEVPIGAVLVLDNQMIGKGYNSPIKQHNPSAHAEMLALQSAALHLSNYRLPRATLYTTLEPCLMCAGAMVHARIERLIFGAFDLRAGAVVSQAQVLDHGFLNHRIQHAGGLCADECGALLKNFFSQRRK